MTDATPATPGGGARTDADEQELPVDSFEEFYEHAPCGLLTMSADDIITRVNQTFLDWTGHASSEVSGRSFESLLTAGSRLFYQTRFQPVLRLNGEVREVALELQGADGERLPILVNATLRNLGADRPPQILAAVFDARERSHYERDLLDARRAAERSESRVRVLQAASSTFGSCETEPAVTDALVRIAVDAFDATSAAVVSVNRDGTYGAAAGDHPYHAVVASDDDRPEDDAVEGATVVHLSDAAEAAARFPGITAPLVDARVEALSAAPIFIDEVVVGVLMCFFGRRRTFDEQSTDLLIGLGRLAAQALQRIRLQHELRHLALHDSLTGLANRQLLRERLGQVLAAARRHGRPLAVVVVDLDGFKAINDRLGHGVGDVVLRQVARRLQRIVRANDTIARPGGDEFVIVSEEIDADAANRLGDRIREGMRTPLDGVPSEYRLTASVGVASHEGAGSVSGALMLQAADAAMYQSKQDGKDRTTTVTV